MQRFRFKALAIVSLVVLGGLFISRGISTIQPNDSNTPPSSAPESSGLGVSEPTDKNTTVNKTSRSPAVSAENKPSFGQLKVGETKEKFITIGDKTYPLRVYQTMATPNDPLANQWAITNAKLPEAWDTPSGNNETLLAVIDTGFALNHEEFSGRWQTNNGESGAASSENPSRLNCSDRGLAVSASCNLIDDDGDAIVDNEAGSSSQQNQSQLNCSAQSKPITKDCNLIDDDNNGYADDYRGWDFNNFDRSVQTGEINPSGSGTTHGTLVTGLAAATGNNTKGIAGVDWGTKILPIQALSDEGVGYTTTVGRAIYYAIARGADVINLSLGSSQPDAYVEEAVQAAVQAGIIVVAAAGNDGCNCMVYPANYPEVVAVGALNSSSQRASFSSYGANLDIMAPGTNITSSSWNAGSQISAYTSGVNGTSFAAPIIAGMLTRLIGQQPSLVPLQLVSAITENTNRLSLSAASPHDARLGYGALDAQKSTLRIITPRSLAQMYTFANVSHGSDYEPAGSYYIYECTSNYIGGTALYELSKPGSRFFTISKVEMKRGLAQGYASRLLSHSCLTMPHDTPSLVRNLNVNLEF